MCNTGTFRALILFLFFSIFFFLSLIAFALPSARSCCNLAPASGRALFVLLKINGRLKRVRPFLLLPFPPCPPGLTPPSPSPSLSLGRLIGLLNGGTLKKGGQGSTPSPCSGRGDFRPLCPFLSSCLSTSARVKGNPIPMEFLSSFSPR